MRLVDQIPCKLYANILNQFLEQFGKYLKSVV